MKKAIIVEIDGPLANSETKNELHKLKCNPWCKELIDAMFYRNVTVIFVTNRTERFIRETRDWLIRHNIRYSELFMAIEGQTDLEAKKYIYEAKIKNKFQILFAIENSEEMAAQWRKLGLVCLLGPTK